MVFKNRYCKRCGDIFQSNTKFGRYCQDCIKPTGGKIKIESKGFAFYLGVGFQNDKRYKDVRA